MVSIITPVYNTEKILINECTESILASLYSDFEWIIVDDGSINECAMYLDKISEQDKRIRIIHTVNGGPSAARNIGIDNAKGDYITFVDSDDIISEDYIGSMVKSLEKYGSDISISSLYRIRGMDISVEKKNYHNFKIDISDYSMEDIYTQMYFGFGLNCGYASSEIWLPGFIGGKLYSKAAIGTNRFNLELVNGEDQIFTLQILKNSRIISFTAEGKYFYRETEGSLQMSYKNNTFEKYKLFYKELEKNIKKYPELLSQKILAEIWMMISMLVKTLEKDKAKKELRKIFSDKEMNHYFSLIRLKYIKIRYLKNAQNKYDIIKCILIKTHSILGIMLIYR